MSSLDLTFEMSKMARHAGKERLYITGSQRQENLINKATAGGNDTLFPRIYLF